MIRSLVKGCLGVAVVLAAGILAYSRWPAPDPAADPAWHERLQGMPSGTDADEDGLADSVELILKTEPGRFDSDGNGISDGDEDIDANGVPNRQEIWVRYFLAPPQAEPEKPSLAEVGER